jgi:integrase
MATFKAVVKSCRKDGFYPVYIRVTQNAKLAYIPTGKYVRDNMLSRSGEINDPYVMQFCTAKIVSFIERLNRVDAQSWNVKAIVRFVTSDEHEDISFSEYGRYFINKMFQQGHISTSNTYEMALKHLERFAGTNAIMFSQLTSAFVNSWIESMSSTKRAKEMYPVCVRQIFKSAVLEYNDYDTGELRIRTNPWARVKIPQHETPNKKAITAQQAREFFSAPLPEAKYKAPLTELARDVSMLVLCLAGINAVDLYNMKKSDYYNGILHYMRAKTRHARADSAYIEMRVPPLLYPIFEKYKAAADDEYLFSFHKRFHSSSSFTASTNVGIKGMCDSIGVHGASRYSVYTWRHTWATLAQNDCKATLEQVGFAMNHSQPYTRVTRGYVKIDYTPAWELNEKVVELVFFSNPTDKDEEQKTAKPDSRVFSFTAADTIAATAYFRGRVLGEVRDRGFKNVDDVVKALSVFVSDDVPARCMVQFKIEIIEKELTQFFERMKGDGNGI